MSEIQREKTQVKSWTNNKFKESLVIKILNLKTEPDILKKLLEIRKNRPILKENIPVLTQDLLLDIVFCNIGQLIQIMAQIKGIESEKEKTLEK